MEDLRELPPPPPPDLYDEAIMRTLLNMLAACVRNRATSVATARRLCDRREGRWGQAYPVRARPGSMPKA